MEKELLDKISHLDKRIDDIKSFITLIVGTGTTVLGFLAVIFTWNVNAEKAELREFKKDLQQEVLEAVGKVNAAPVLSLETRDGEPLHGSVILTTVHEDDAGDQYLRVPFDVINTGKGRTGEIAVKFYTDENIVGGTKISREKDFSYMSISQGKEETGLPNMPGSLSAPYDYLIWTTDKTIPPFGEYPAMVRFYYGKGNVEEARFTLKIDRE